MPDEKPGEPLSDISFDDIFGPSDPAQEKAPTEALQTAPPEPEPQAPAPEFYLRTNTGTVYKTPEDAIRGTEEKDRLIEQLRMQAIASTGYDPVNGKPVRVSPQSQEANYAMDPDAYYRDLAEANGGPGKPADVRKFQQVQMKFLRDAMSPYMPVITQTSKEQVVAEVSKTVPDFREFLSSDGFRSYLDQRPHLKSAVQIAESAPEMAPALREYYFLAYEGSKGRSLPEILKAAKPTVQTQQVAPRPTMTATTNAPPSQGSAPNMATAEGRRAIIENFKSRGFDDVKLPF